MVRTIAISILLLLPPTAASACMIVPSAMERIWWPIGIMTVTVFWACAAIFIAVNECSRKVQRVTYGLYSGLVIILLVRVFLNFNIDGAVDCGYRTSGNIAAIALASLCVAAISTFIGFVRLVKKKI